MIPVKLIKLSREEAIKYSKKRDWSFFIDISKVPIFDVQRVFAKEDAIFSDLDNLINKHASRIKDRSDIHEVIPEIQAEMLKKYEISIDYDSLYDYIVDTKFPEFRVVETWRQFSDNFWKVIDLISKEIEGDNYYSVILENANLREPIKSYLTKLLLFIKKDISNYLVSVDYFEKMKIDYDAPVDDEGLMLFIKSVNTILEKIKLHYTESSFADLKDFFNAYMEINIDEMVDVHDIAADIAERVFDILVREPIAKELDELRKKVGLTNFEKMKDITFRAVEEYVDYLIDYIKAKIIDYMALDPDLFSGILDVDYDKYKKDKSKR